MRWLSLGLLFITACQGLATDRSNAYPCDFSQAPGLRDAVCAPGDVCGLHGRCQRFVYEGPRFEGPATLPDFSSDAGAGDILHPQVLRDRPLAIVREATSRALVLSLGEGRLVRVGPGGLEELGTLPPLARVSELLTVFSNAQNQQFAVVRTPTLQGRVFSLAAGPLTMGDDLGPLERLHLLDAVAPNAPLAIATTGQGYARLNPGTGGRPAQVDAVTLALPVYDVGFSARPSVFEGIILVTDGGLVAPSTDGGALVLSGDELVGFGEGSTLRQDRNGNVFSVMTPTSRLGGAGQRLSVDVLSTWELVRTAAGPRMQRVWSDCAPCGERGASAFSPALASQGLVVDVVCTAAVGAPLGVRITGSSATTDTQPCVAEPLAAPFAMAELAVSARPNGRPGLTLMHDEVGLQGFAFAGRHGQVWAGATLDLTRPLFLDRIPLDVATTHGVSGLTEVALTGSSLARLATTPGSNGFVRVELPPIAQGIEATPRALALIRQSGAWVLSSTGDLVELPFGRDGGLPSFGPRLVDDRGEPVTSGLWGEALQGRDGGIVSMLVAADDGLYFVPSALLGSPVPDSQRAWPVLRPEPGSPIRHLALERTPLGTNGIDRVRAYLVTSRAVFEVVLGGKPARWSANPLPLAGGEPAEVWFDNPRGGLGRVGYRDGRVFTLPGGFQLTEPLPADGGVPPQVLDYENLSGWPLALANTGLYVAQWDKKGTGSLDNKFEDGGVNKPMTWREVRLPDGGAPWFEARPGGPPMVRSGKLFVREEPETRVTDADGTTYQRPSRAFLYLDTIVYEVGQHLRSNVTPAN